LVGRQLPRCAAELLDEREGRTSARGDSAEREAAPVLAPPRAAEALDLAEGARTRLILDDARPVELSTIYLPVDLASSAMMGRAAQGASGFANRNTIVRKGRAGTTQIGPYLAIGYH
jgi:hypothetical protein